MLIRPESDVDKIIMLNVSSFSNILSSIIGRSNEKLVTPSGNVTEYGPDS